MNKRSDNLRQHRHDTARMPGGVADGADVGEVARGGQRAVKCRALVELHFHDEQAGGMRTAPGPGRGKDLPDIVEAGLPAQFPPSTGGIADQPGRIS